MNNPNPSSLSSQEEETTMFYQSHITPRSSSKSHINSYGVPIKSSGKSTAVIAIQENREREKRELSHLNDRFASYIERVRFLEAQNKKLQFEIDHLQQKWGSQSSKIKEIYDVDIRKARHTIDDTTKDCATSNLRAKHTEEETLKLKDKCNLLLAGRDSDRQRIELLEKQLLDNEADLNLLHRRLTDLEDEQKRYHLKSQKLILDLQRLTKDLDHETIKRIDLENQKQTLQEEIHFLKEIHSHEIEEFKQINTTFDPSIFFQNQLSNAVRNIREEYEQLNHEQRKELQSWYQSKVTQAIQEIQSRPGVKNSSDNIRQQEEIKKLRTLVSDTRQDIVSIQQRNDELEKRIRELEELIQTQRDNNSRGLNERDHKIKDLRSHLRDLGRDYDELISTKSTLDSEINLYRKLLEGEEKRGGLKQIAANVEEQVRNNFSTIESTDYQQQKTSGIQGFGNKNLILKSYVPLESSSSTRTESTSFEQVYGGYRRRPATICLNTQWTPVVNPSGNYNINRNDVNHRTFKTETFSDSRRKSQQPKAVTPPSSDYTDAYLSAFAHKTIPTKHIHRLTTPVFVTVTPIPFNSIKMSETRFNNIQTSTSIDSSTSSSKYIPDISTNYKPLSTTQPSAPQTQTFTPNYSTTLLNTQPPKTTSYIAPRPYSSTIPSTYSFYDNIYKPIPSHPPLTTYSPMPSTYKPSVLFQSAPLSFYNGIHQNKINTQTVLTTEKQINRPDTLQFQPDEDILPSSSIGKPSPSITPSLESPTTRLEPKVESSIISSKPIEILENTLGKYDSLINQISDILSSVSPLSSTISSMSPGKSVLDYELSSDGSPLLQRKPTVSVNNTNTQRVNARHLIREDSYDKIITAIKDLDAELTPPLDTQTSTAINEEEENKSITSSTEEFIETTETLSFDESQISSLPDDKNEEREILSTNEEFVQQQTGLLSNVPNDKISEFYDIIISSNENEKHLTWNEIPVNNAELQSLSEVVDKSTTIIEPQINSQQIPLSEHADLPDSTKSETNVIEPQMESPDSFFSDFIDRQITSPDLNESQSSHDEQLTSSINSIHTQFESFNKNNMTTDEHSTTISDLNIDPQLEEDEPNKLETKPSTIQNISSLSLLIIISPIDTLSDSISTRYISCDVYYGYLGEHIQFIENASNIDMENTKISLPITETQPLKNESELVDSSQNENRLAPASFQEENQLTAYASEESETITSNLLADKQAILSTSSAEQVQPIPEDPKVPPIANNLTILKSNEIESTLSSLLDSIQQKVSDTTPTEEKQIVTLDISHEESIDNLVNTSPNVVVNPPMGNIEQIVPNTNTFIIEQTENQENVIVESPSSKTSTVLSDQDKTIGNIPTQFDEETINTEPVPFQIVETTPINQKSEDLTLAESKTIESIISAPVLRDNEQMLTTNVVLSEPIPNTDIRLETVDVINSEQKTDENKTSLDDVPRPPATITEKIENNISSSFILPSIQQDFVSMNDQPNTELVTSLENLQEKFSPSQEIEQIATLHNSQSNNKIPIEEIKSPTTDESTSPLNENKSITPKIDNIMQISTTEFESPPSVVTAIENISSKSSIYLREPSPANTEPNSLELINTLRGHSIALPNRPEKSSSSTTSSQVTSSDRYVSYAIHEMNDSSSISSSDRYVSYAIHEMGDSSQDRLPVIPIAADIPIYKNTGNVQLESIVNNDRSVMKEDDLTELDATDNLTSCSDDVLLQRRYISNANRQKDLDGSSTDDDVDDAFEQHDLTNIHHIIHKLTQPTSSISTNEEAYQRYDRAITPSSNDSLSSPRQQVDDIYLIPGYPGFWRPSTERDSSSLLIDYDADDERKTASKTRTTVNISNSARRPLSFQPDNLPQRPDTLNLFNRSLNEYPVDLSETDSYQTCPSSISTQKKQSNLNKIKKSSNEQHPTSPDENIFLIREHARGVSLPITLKIDCNNIPLPSSISAPIETQLFPTTSPSANNEQKLPSWLNTVNTATTTDGPLASRITFLKSSKGPISISECHPQGYYIILENTSRSKYIDLTNWKLLQINENEENLIFIFPNNYFLKPNHSIKILTKLNQSEQRNDDLIASSLSSWYTGANIITKLINSEDKDCATLIKKTILS